MSDLNDLFDAVDGLQEDLMEYGILGGAAVAASVGYNYLSSKALEQFGAKLPEAVVKWGPAALAVGLGAFGVPYAAGKFGFRGRAATGASVGLMVNGITRLVGLLAPTSGLPLAIEGLNDVPARFTASQRPPNLFQKYLGDATVSVEPMNNGMGAASMSVEEVSGLGDTVVEESMSGFGAAPSWFRGAASLQ